MNALRLTDGIALTLFSERTGLPVTVLQLRSKRERVNVAYWVLIKNN